MLKLILRELPLFSTFFFSSLGFGGMQIARPLLGAEFGASIFFIGLLSTTSALASLIGAPIAGNLTDRWGRRPLVVLGLTVRVFTGFASVLVTSYEQFFVLEFIGSMGLSFWNTGVNVIIADVTSPENRGRTMALRTASQKLGILCGPAISGILADIFGLRSIFLLNSGTKLIALAIFITYIAETRPDAATRAAGKATERLPLSTFFNRRFLVLAMTSFTIYMVAQGGAFESLFPVHARGAAGVTTAQIGWALSLLNLMSFAISFPGGALTDRFGRKAVLLPGLLLLGAGTSLLAGISDYTSVLIALAVMGMGDGLSTGAALVMAMDMAPAAQRGTFLGIWAFIDRTGAVMAPIVMGAIASAFGIPAAFFTVTGCMVVMFGIMWLFGPETQGRKRAAAVAAAK